MTNTTYPLTGLHCQACVRRVREALAPLAGAVEVQLAPMQAVLTDARADLPALQAAVAGAGQYTLQAALEPYSQAFLEPKQPDASVHRSSLAIENVAPSTKTWLATYYPLLLILAFILAASVLVQVGQSSHGTRSAIGWKTVQASETMRLFMAGFFLVFAFFKLLDLRAFANAYAGYDLLAQRWQGWGMAYPFVELALGVAYLTHWQPTLTHSATIIVMGFSAIGVIQAVLRKTQIRCACLGTGFNLPMSTVTILEDLGMVAMAAWMLAFA